MLQDLEELMSKALGFRGRVMRGFRGRIRLQGLGYLMSVFMV
jgi:hypothetical protein